MWLHNTSSTARDQLRPHCGELRSAAGAQLQAHVTFDPPVVDAVARRVERAGDGARRGRRRRRSAWQLSGRRPGRRTRRPLAQPRSGRPVTEAVVDLDPRVEELLDDVGRRVRRAMLDAIPDGEPHRWLYRLARAYPSRPGKAIRPSLCIATCRAFGGARRRRGADRRGHRAPAQRVPRPRRHRRRQRAASWCDARCPPSTAWRWPSTPATRWPCSPTRCCAVT